MLRFALLVNPLVLLLRGAPLLVLVELPRCGDQNYSKATFNVQAHVLRCRHLFLQQARPFLQFALDRRFRERQYRPMFFGI